MTHEEWQEQCEQVIKEDLRDRLISPIGIHGNNFCCYLEEKGYIDFNEVAKKWVEETKDGDAFFRKEMDKVIDVMPAPEHDEVDI